MLPALAGIRTVETTLTAGHKYLAIWRHGHATYVGCIVRHFCIFPGFPTVVRNQHSGTRRRYDQFTMGAHRDEVLLAGNRTTLPELALVGAGE